MNSQLKNYAGIALMTGAALLVITMILHPVGGDFEHLLKMYRIIIISHSLAIVSIPITLFGYWGISQRLKEEPAFSTAAFVMICFGSFAIMCAAAVNGLALPFLINRYREAGPELIDSLRPVLAYNYALNHAFDYIYIGSACAAVLLWSIAIVRTNYFPNWAGYFGILLGAAAILLLLSGFVFVDLSGFRLFVVGIVSWTSLMGVLLFRQSAN